jgi:hypothetical protein
MERSRSDPFPFPSRSSPGVRSELPPPPPSCDRPGESGATLKPDRARSARFLRAIILLLQHLARMRVSQVSDAEEDFSKRGPGGARQSFGRESRRDSLATPCVLDPRRARLCLARSRNHRRGSPPIPLRAQTGATGAGVRHGSNRARARPPFTEQSECQENYSSLDLNR